MTANSPALSEQTRAAVIVLCEPERQATHGDARRMAVSEWLRAQSWSVDENAILDFDPAELTRAFGALRESADLIVICGGTGIGARDIAPQTLEPLCDFAIPGIGELLRAESLKYSLNSHLSRCCRTQWSRRREHARAGEGSATRSSRAYSVPAGTIESSPALQRWELDPTHFLVREGRMKRVHPFSRPSGTQYAFGSRSQR